MKDAGLAGRHKRRFRTTTDSKHSRPIAANVLMRQFDVEAISVAWATNLTYLATLDGWLHLGQSATRVRAASSATRRGSESTRSWSGVRSIVPWRAAPGRGTS